MKQWLYELAIALGLVEPPRLQPIPVKSDEARRRDEQQRRRR